MTILVIKGSYLDGASEGLKYYVGDFNFETLKKPTLWKDAVKFSYFKSDLRLEFIN
jgi:SNF family Na+-dependent transporter